MSSSRLLCACLALGALGGCQFFARDGGHETNRPFLTPLQSSKDAIRLDVLLIDRRVDDPLIGPLLWREVDQVGAVSTETRELLLQNGYVVGHAAAKPPQALLKLMGVVAEIEGLEDAVQPQVTGRTYSIRSGTETEIQTSEWWPECELTVHDGGKSRSLQFRQAELHMRRADHQCCPQGELETAADRQALLDAGRRVLRIHLGEHPVQQIEALK